MTASIAAELQAKRKIVKRVPKGTSEYQAAWIIDSEDEVWILICYGWSVSVCVYICAFHLQILALT